MNISNLIRDNIRSLAPYSTARDEYDGDLGIYLDANENPYDNGVNRYPDPHQRLLKTELQRIKGVDSSRIFIGNGSDEAIDLLFRIFCIPGVSNAVSIAPTYGMYKVAAAINDVAMREVPLDEEFRLDVDTLLAATDAATRLLFICSPNNPSGNSFPVWQIEEVLRRFGGMVVVDEAYIDFASQPSLLSLLDSYPNLIVLQTMSKGWGMAGLRMGLAFADPLVIETMGRVKYPYNINVLTQRMVLEKLRGAQSAPVDEIIAQRAWLIEALATVPVIKKVFPTDANFVLVRVEEPQRIYNELIKAGIIVRDRSRIAGCEGCLRITVGTPGENAKLIEILKNL